MVALVLILLPVMLRPLQYTLTHQQSLVLLQKRRRKRLPQLQLLDRPQTTLKLLVPQVQMAQTITPIATPALVKKPVTSTAQKPKIYLDDRRRFWNWYCPARW